MRKDTKPPAVANCLLTGLLSPDHDSLLGDLHEEFHERRSASGSFVAKLVFWLQTFKLIPLFTLYHLLWSQIMLKNYFKIAFRNFQKHKGYSLLNILGLVVGIASFILIMFFVKDELSYDRYHKNRTRIYRLIAGLEGATWEAIAKVGGPWGPAAGENIPEVEESVRFSFFGTALVNRGDKRFYESGGFYADSTVFEVFSFTFLQGDPKSALVQPQAVVLTESLARKYFGHSNPLGQSLTFGQGHDYVITGVIKDIPPNSHFTFTFLASLSTTQSPYWSDMSRIKDQWQFFQSYTYLLLAEGVNPESIPPKFVKLLENNLGKEDASKYTIALQPLTDIHLHSHIWREISTNSDISRVYIFSAIALFILLIACINFMNLSSARASNRAVEVGLRKVVGAHRFALVKQLLGESVLISLFALALAIVVADLVLPHFNSLVGKQLVFNLGGSGWFLLGLVGVSLFVGIISGSYPALILSAFKPAQVLKGNLQSVGKSGLRKALVVVQFAISTGLFIATGTVFSQMQFIQNKKLGFNKEQLVIIPLRNQTMQQNYETVKQELLRHPRVVSASASANQPGGSDWSAAYRVEGFPEDQTPPGRLLVVDHDFIETYQIKVTQGRNFSREFSTDTGGAVMLNEEAARQLGWTESVGGKITLSWWDTEATVVGVVRDFHFRSFHEEIGPLFLYVAPESFNRITVRIETENVSETIDYLRKTWQAFDPEQPFTYTFFDQQFDALHQAEEQFGQALTYFAGLAIFIACLGLFGLASFTTEQRTKEIGVRKAVGASTSQIFLLLSKDFAKLVGLAFIVACPIAYFAMERWLQNFAYRADLKPEIFFLAGAVSLLIASMTISYQSIRAALTNPVHALRYE